MDKTPRPSGVQGSRNWQAVAAHLRTGAGPIGKRDRRRQKALRQAARKQMADELRALDHTPEAGDS